MRDNTIETFFALVRAGLFPVHGEGVMVHDSLFKDVDWNEVYQMAQEQSVQGLVLAGLEYSDLKPPKELLLQWIGEVQLIGQRNKAMNVYIADLIEEMRSVGIYTLLVKGQGIAQCYERPLWRCSGDVDLLLSESNYVKAKDLLMPMASSIDTEGEYNKHLGMTIDAWTVELHGSLSCGLSSRVDGVLAEVKDSVFHGGNVRSWMNGETQVFLPGIDADAIYVFTHFLEHFYKGGLGLRQVCDWCRLLWTYRDSLNQELLKSRIKKAGLMSEWKAFGALSVDYLGMPAEAMPFYSADKKWSRKAEKICSFILKVGNMGHNRDMSYYEKYPYLIRKVCSMGRRCGDLICHARIFPLDSVKFFPRIMFNGLRSAARGE